MDPQLVPIAPDMKTDMRRILFASWLTAETGDLRKLRHFARLIAVRRIVKKRATLGKAWIQ
jgi:hypothetical protein